MARRARDETRDERCLAERGPGDGVDALDADPNAISSRLLERGPHDEGGSEGQMTQSHESP